jgi:hypothetical protein
MSQVLRTYIQEVEKARKDLNRVNGQLQSQKRRDDLRLLVERYFSEVRPTLVSKQEQDESIKLIDDRMQELLVLCHKKSMGKRYQEILAHAKGFLIAVDSEAVAAAGQVADKKGMEVVDTQIIGTLQSIVPSAALSYEQATADIHSAKRMSWRGPATDLREALRETLDHLAPDKDVKAMPGYKQDASTDGPTMKQKVRYILRNRGASKAVSGPAEEAVDAVEEAVGSFVRSVYTRSNVSTHTPTDKTEVLRVRDLVRIVLCELLEIHAHR